MAKIVFHSDKQPRNTPEATGGGTPMPGTPYGSMFQVKEDNPGDSAETRMGPGNNVRDSKKHSHP